MLWLVATMLFVLFAVSYLAKNQHHIAQQKQYLYARHSNYITRMQSLLDQLPEQYVPKDIHLLLLEEIIAHLQSQWQLFPHNKALPKYIKTKMEQRERVLKTDRSLSAEIFSADDLKRANRIRRRLHQLCRFTERAVNLKKITRPEGIQYIQTMKSLSTEIAATFHLALAEKSLQRDKSKMAIYYYSRAINEYTKYNPNGRYDDKIEALRQNAEQLKTQDRTNPDREKKQISSKDSTRLTIEMNAPRRPGFMRTAN